MLLDNRPYLLRVRWLSFGNMYCSVQCLWLINSDYLSTVVQKQLQKLVSIDMRHLGSAVVTAHYWLRWGCDLPCALPRYCLMPVMQLLQPLLVQSRCTPPKTPRALQERITEPCGGTQMSNRKVAFSILGRFLTLLQLEIQKG